MARCNEGLGMSKAAELKAGTLSIGLDQVISKADKRAYRLSEIDALRGLAIIIMALDHLRDFCSLSTQQDPMANPDISLSMFLTRWITHFCAPVFILLAGTSAGLMVNRKSPRELFRFLFTRGLWLLFVEWFVISTAWTFAPGGIEQVGGRTIVIMQVIWAIGASMIVLSIISRFGRTFCLASGIAISVLHNLLDFVWPASKLFDQAQPPWVLLHSQVTYSFGPFLLIFIYPLLPWIGVMLLGFGIASVFERAADVRNKILFRSGIAMIAAFLIIRALDLYGDPNTWIFQPAGFKPTIMDFLNTTKYPPSLSFLLMTLGPASVFCAMASHITGPVKNTLVMYGHVPFAFYVAHFYVIHALSILLGVLQGFNARDFLTYHMYYPSGYGLPLPGIYALWLLVLLILYPFCRWFAGVKARRRDWWLSYL